VKRAPELAEFIGAFAIVFAGAGAIMVNATTGALGHVGIALTFGLVVGAMIFATGHISGAHFNPAVTIAFAATKKFPWDRVPKYVASQVAGAITGSAVLWWILGDAGNSGATLPAEFISPVQLIVIEAILSFFLMLVISAVATDSRAVGPLSGVAIGSTVALDAMMGGPLTGASMNPARSIGPALFDGDLQWLPHYILAPIFGAVLAAVTYEGLRKGTAPAPKKRVLFVCVGNSCRSQMAEGFARKLGFTAASAGTEPTSAVNATAIAVMKEAGIDISKHVPSRLDFATLDRWDRVITMGCGVQESCPTLRTDEDWGLEDPVGEPIETFRAIRDEVARRVTQLAEELK
jgi:aquaporin NIP